MADEFIWAPTKRNIEFDENAHIRVFPDNAYVVLSKETIEILHGIRGESRLLNFDAKYYYVDIGMSPDTKTIAIRPGSARQINDENKVVWRELQNCVKGQYNLAYIRDGTLYFEME